MRIEIVVMYAFGLWFCHREYNFFVFILSLKRQRAFT